MTNLERQLTEALQTIGNLPLEFNGRARAIAQKFVTAPAGGWKDGLSPEQINNLLAWSAPTKEKKMDGRNPEYFDHPKETKQPETETKSLKPCVNYPCRYYASSRPNSCTQPDPARCDDYMTAKVYLPPAIEMIAVESSMLDGVGHDGNQTLRAWFKNGSPFDYVGTPEQALFDIVNADSAGAAFNVFRKKSAIQGIKL